MGESEEDYMIEFQSTVDYYAHAKYPHHIQRVCNEALDKKGVDETVIRFWRAYAIAEEGSYTEAIREFEPLRTRPIVALATTAALIQTHKLCQVKDKEALSELKDQLKKYSASSSDAALIFAGRYFWHAGKAKHSRQCIEKVLNKNKRNMRALAVYGWLNLTSGTSRYERKSVTLFDTAIKLTAENGQNKQDLSSLLGRARYNEMKKKYTACLEDLNLAIVSFPDFLPGLVEKARTLMIMGNWDEALAVSHRVLRKDQYNIGVLRLIVLYLLARESKSLAANNRIRDLSEAVDKYEPNNAELYYSLSQLCARLAGKKPAILQLTMGLVEHACKLDPMKSSYLTEQAHQLMLLEEYEQASMYYSEASKLDEGNLAAVDGRIKCKILQGNYKEAEQELEFLTEIASTEGSAELIFLGALIAQKNGEEEKALTLLNEAIDEHLKLLEGIPPGYDYFVAYNPDFVLEVVSEYMGHIGTEPMHPSDPPSALLKKSIELLVNFTELVPGMIGAQLLLCRANYIQGDFDEAEKALITCLKLDPQFAPAMIVQAQICLAKENFKQCQQSLDQARSLDFEIRNTPLYHSLRAQWLEASGQREEALRMLETAMALEGVREVADNGTKPLSIQERMSIFVDLAMCHAKLEQLPEAAKVMSDAKERFKNASEFQRIIIADAELACLRRDYQAALGMLRNIPSDSQYYARGKMKMAEIYLKYKKNKKLYAACYEELAYQGNTVHTYVLLGEAYMNIQQPQKAIRAYENALKLNPDDPTLASRIGRALVTIHAYDRAVSYYETAAKGDPSKVYLFHELAELYLQLRKWEQAVRVLGHALDAQKKPGEEGVNPDDVHRLMNDVKSSTLLSEVYQGAGDMDNAKKALTEAWNLQMMVGKFWLRHDNQDARREQKGIAAEICFKLAAFYKDNAEKAQQFYNEALKHNDSHEASRLALARMHLQKGELDQCQHQCVFLMRIDPSNQEASMMLADLMFRKNEHEAATFHFQQLLDKNPTRYVALNKLIQLLRRAGRLSDAPRFLKLAERSSAKANFSPGLHYCKGLYHWYSNDMTEALNQFNQARTDGEWGTQALMNMIEIYLNPDNAALFTESAEAKGDNSEHVVFAEKLLAELNVVPQKTEAQEKRMQVLRAYAQMATKNRSKIEKALQELVGLAQADSTYVPAVLGMANAYMLLNQTPKAKNQLKRVAKLKLIPDYSPEFEKCWLMLADIYINSGKYDLANDLCKKCLNSNKSSAKAWEQLGVIMEKEQAYRDASENYEHAWSFMNESSPALGYKLAFNYLKAKRFVEAIDVCHKVLAVQPDYPKIRKDILDKARASLRP